MSARDLMGHGPKLAKLIGVHEFFQIAISLNRYTFDICLYISLLSAVTSRLPCILSFRLSPSRHLSGVVVERAGQ